jgi:hypothetical protein
MRHGIAGLPRPDGPFFFAPEVLGLAGTQGLHFLRTTAEGSLNLGEALSPTGGSDAAAVFGGHDRER